MNRTKPTSLIGWNYRGHATKPDTRKCCSICKDVFKVRESVVSKGRREMRTDTAHYNCAKKRAIKTNGGKWLPTRAGTVALAGVAGVLAVVELMLWLE